MQENRHRYPWAARHTWQSWRERYRKRQDFFDPIIERIVATDLVPREDGNGQYRFARRRVAAGNGNRDEEEERSSSEVGEADPEYVLLIRILVQDLRAA